MHVLTTILLILHIAIVVFQIMLSVLDFLAIGRFIGSSYIIKPSRKEKIVDVFLQLSVLLYNITMYVLLLFIEFKLWILICGIVISLPILALLIYGCLGTILELRKIVKEGCPEL